MKYTTILGACCVFLLVFGASFAIIFIPAAYPVLYRHTGVYDTLPHANVMTANVLAFLQHRADLEYFSEEEQSHMMDVRQLIDRGYGIMALATVLLCILLRRDSTSWKHMVRYGSYACVIALLLFVIAGLNFSWLFDQFHTLFFPQGNYIFPEGSLLITLFPQSFFVGMSVLIGIAVLALSVAGIVLSYSYLHVQRHKRR